MSRRNAAVKRPVLPDPQFNNRLATMLVARLMKHGKKSTAQRILSDAFSLIGDRTGGDPIELFETAVKNATPLVEVRARRVGGATYQVPMEVRQERGTAMALRWLVSFSVRIPAESAAFFSCAAAAGENEPWGGRRRERRKRKKSFRCSPKWGPSNAAITGLWVIR